VDTAFFHPGVGFDSLGCGQFSIRQHTPGVSADFTPGVEEFLSSEKTLLSFEQVCESRNSVNHLSVFLSFEF